jgi:hypothetical protein
VLSPVSDGARGWAPLRPSHSRAGCVASTSTFDATACSKGSTQTPSSRVIPLGERHLKQILHEYVDHYHAERDHQGLHNNLIKSTADDAAATSGIVLRRRRLGGVLNYYFRDAA